MTAINVFRYRDGACVLTDGAQYLADGTLMATCAKVQILAHCRAVLASRSPKLFLPLIADHLGTSFDGFDALVDGLVEAVRVGHAMHAGLFQLCDLGSTFDLIVVGWSESRDRAETWGLFNHDAYGVPAWTLTELAPVMIAPHDEAMNTDLGLTDAQLAGDLHPVEDGLRILERQRLVAAPQGDRKEASHGVGGFAQMTLVGRDQIETRILRRWPDRLGEKLGAAA